MRKTLVSLALGAMLVGLTGCGTVPVADKGAAPGYQDGIDTQLMADVEARAARSGAEVYWINPPLKHK